MPQDEEAKKQARREAQQRHQAKNPAYYKEKRKRFMEANPEKKAQYAKNYYENHKNEINTKSQKRNRERLIKQRLEAFSLLGGVCFLCGYSDPRALEIDHVNGGGGIEIKELNNQGAYLRMVKASAETKEGKYQLLCANCHAIKHCSTVWKDIL